MIRCRSLSLRATGIHIKGEERDAESGGPWKRNKKKQRGNMARRPSLLEVIKDDSAVMTKRSPGSTTSSLDDVKVSNNELCVD